MSRSIWYLYRDISTEDQDLLVVEDDSKTVTVQVTEGGVIVHSEESVAYRLETTPAIDVLATYSVDNDYDFGSITVQDTILEMHDQGLRTSPGVHKLTDGFYTAKSQYAAVKQSRQVYS